MPSRPPLAPSSTAIYNPTPILLQSQNPIAKQERLCRSIWNQEGVLGPTVQKRQYHNPIYPIQMQSYNPSSIPQPMHNPFTIQEEELAEG